ncbi:hypothetical protein PV326_005974 [Microctonus aethiopoides]|nr:hypothetical protein PV326_005974 [Microctonus aethiopoides]
MLHLFLHIIVKFIIILHCVSSENSLKHNGNLPDDAMQMCIDSFDIHKDKIIRTQDSLSLGAKYIMEIELDGREECLKLCCKTDECDVFIFEEKKQGSCYLFHCGPPHDFKCKFTSHANYTSAVRLEEQLRRSQQEHELKSLRKIAERVSLDYSYTEPPIIVQEMTESSKISTSTTPIPIKIPCTRNQYECRASGECIAIYNVCDGIPQCTDGSDEALDLGCPTEKPTPPPLTPHAPIPPATELLKYPSVIQHYKNFPAIYGNSNSPLKPWQIPLSAHQGVSQQQNPQYPPQQAVMPMPQVNYGSQGYMNGWEYRQMYEQNKEPYQINPIRAKVDLPHYNNEQPHIFNHKRPGMMPENLGDNSINYIEPERSYESYYTNQNHENWPTGQRPAVELQPKLQLLPTIPPVVLTKQEQIIPAVQQQIKNPINSTPLEIKAIADKTVPIKESLSIKKELETQKNIHPSKESESSVIDKVQTLSKKDVDSDKLTDLNRQKSEDQHSELRVHHFMAEHLQQNNHKSNNEILRPRGAVISLALGLTATAIMAALITCRLRVVRKRGRRGHGPYAHDADYLVNGMYL